MNPSFLAGKKRCLQCRGLKKLWRFDDDAMICKKCIAIETEAKKLLKDKFCQCCGKIKRVVDFYSCQATKCKTCIELLLIKEPPQKNINP